MVSESASQDGFGTLEYGESMLIEAEDWIWWIRKENSSRQNLRVSEGAGRDVAGTRSPG